MVAISKSNESLVDQKLLQSLLTYCPLTGLFKWRVRRGRSSAGATAGRSEAGCGYIRIRINGREYLAQRLAWLHMTGEWPETLIDHKNRVKTDNRWFNLRLANHSQNGVNRARKKSSGKKGAFRASKYNRWFSAIRVNGKSIHLGSFGTEDEAAAAYAEASKKYHGEYGDTV